MEIDDSDHLDISTDEIHQHFDVPVAVTQRNGFDKRN